MHNNQEINQERNTKQEPLTLNSQNINKETKAELQKSLNHIKEVLGNNTERVSVDSSPDTYFLYEYGYINNYHQSSEYNDILNQIDRDEALRVLLKNDKDLIKTIKHGISKEIRYIELDELHVINELFDKLEISKEDRCEILNSKAVHEGFRLRIGDDTYYTRINEIYDSMLDFGIDEKTAKKIVLKGFSSSKHFANKMYSSENDSNTLSFLRKIGCEDYQIFNLYAKKQHIKKNEFIKDLLTLNISSKEIDKYICNNISFKHKLNAEHANNFMNDLNYLEELTKSKPNLFTSSIITRKVIEGFTNLYVSPYVSTLEVSKAYDKIVDLFGDEMKAKLNLVRNQEDNMNKYHENIINALSDLLVNRVWEREAIINIIRNYYKCGGDLQEIQNDKELLTAVINGFDSDDMMCINFSVSSIQSKSLRRAKRLEETKKYAKEILTAYCELAMEKKWLKFIKNK